MSVAEKLPLPTWLLALTGLLVFPSCSESTSPEPHGLTGNFEGVLQTGGAPWYLGLSLDERGTQVSGTGFLSVYPGFTATAAGSTNGEQVTFEVSPVGTGLTYQFSGQLRGDTISGSFVPGAGVGLPLELVRVDTVVDGTMRLSLSQSIMREEVGVAYFLYRIEFRSMALALESSGEGPRLHLAFFWDGLQYPPAGTYMVGPSSVPRVLVNEVGGNPGTGRTLTVESGSLVLDLARRFALIGTLDILLRDQEGARTRVKGRFSAGCIEQFC